VVGSLWNSEVVFDYMICLDLCGPNKANTINIQLLLQEDYSIIDYSYSRYCVVQRVSVMTFMVFTAKKIDIQVFGL
jgi:hypothetical protein